MRRAEQAAAATADAAAATTDAAPNDEPPNAEQHVPVSESVPVNEVPPDAHVPAPVPGNNIATVLQRPDEPWRLVSTRSKKSIGHRPPKEATGNKVHGL